MLVLVVNCREMMAISPELLNMTGIARLTASIALQ